MSFQTERPKSTAQMIAELKESKLERTSNRKALLENFNAKKLSDERQSVLEATQAEVEEKCAKNEHIESIRNRRREERAVKESSLNRLTLLESAKKITMNKVLFEMVYDAYWLDDDVKRESIQETYNEYKNVLGLVESVCGSSKTKDEDKTEFIKNVETVVEEACKKAVDRIVKEQKDSGEPDKEFEFTSEEESELDEKLSELGRDELIELIKKKVLTVVQDERKSGKEKAKLLKELDEDDDEDEEDSDKDDENDDDKDDDEDDDEDEKDDNDESVEEGCKPTNEGRCGTEEGCVREGCKSTEEGKCATEEGFFFKKKDDKKKEEPATKYELSDSDVSKLDSMVETEVKKLVNKHKNDPDVKRYRKDITCEFFGGSYVNKEHGIVEIALTVHEGETEDIIKLGFAERICKDLENVKTIKNICKKIHFGDGDEGIVTVEVDIDKAYELLHGNESVSEGTDYMEGEPVEEGVREGCKSTEEGKCATEGCIREGCASTEEGCVKEGCKSTSEGKCATEGCVNEGRCATEEGFFFKKKNGKEPKIVMPSMPMKQASARFDSAMKKLLSSPKYSKIKNMVEKTEECNGEDSSVWSYDIRGKMSEDESTIFADLHDEIDFIMIDYRYSVKTDGNSNEGNFYLEPGVYESAINITPFNPISEGTEYMPVEEGIVGFFKHLKSRNIALKKVLAKLPLQKVCSPIAKEAIELRKKGDYSGALKKYREFIDSVQSMKKQADKIISDNNYDSEVKTELYGMLDYEINEAKKIMAEIQEEKKKKPVSESYKATLGAMIAQKQRRSLRNSMGGTLFESFMIANSNSVRDEAVTEGVDIDTASAMNAALIESILQYTVLETLNTTKLYKFTSSDVNKLKAANRSSLRR